MKRVALLGTRGIPAQHGGFETAVEFIGPGLAHLGWEVTVYCRNPGQTLREYRGTRLVNLPALRLKTAETLSHTGLSTGHALFAHLDVAIVFNSGNAPFVAPLKLRGIPVAVHIDGLESQRAKWAGFGAKYYAWAERSSVGMPTRSSLTPAPSATTCVTGTAATASISPTERRWWTRRRRGWPSSGWTPTATT